MHACWKFVLCLIITVVRCVLALRLKCEDRVCIVYNLRSSVDSFVYRYLPNNTITVVHKHLQVEYADSIFLEDINPQIETVVITDSKPLVRIAISARCYATALTITHTSLSSVSVEENHQLQQLLITHGKLTSVPETIDQLKSLVTLRFNHNLITELDVAQFCLMPKLYYLDVRNNKLSHVFQSVSYNETCPVQVVYLYLARNKLSSLNMTTFNSFARLKYLDVSNNLLRSVAGSFVGPMLSDLRLVHNILTTVSFCRWYVPKLSRIVLNNNKLATIPDCLANVPNVTELSLCSNSITTVALDSFAGLDKLHLLDVCWNRVTSVVLNSTNYPKSLAVIDLSNNRLTQLELSWVPLCNLHLFVTNNFISQFDVSKVSLNVTILAMVGNPIDCSWSAVPLPGVLFVDRASVQCVRNGA